MKRHFSDLVAGGPSFILSQEKKFLAAKAKKEEVGHVVLGIDPGYRNLGFVKILVKGESVTVLRHHNYDLGAGVNDANLARVFLSHSKRHSWFQGAPTDLVVIENQFLGLRNTKPINYGIMQLITLLAHEADVPEVVFRGSKFKFPILSAYTDLKLASLKGLKGSKRRTTLKNNSINLGKEILLAHKTGLDEVFFAIASDAEHKADALNLAVAESIKRSWLSPAPKAPTRP